MILSDQFTDHRMCHVNGCVLISWWLIEEWVCCGYICVCMTSSSMRSLERKARQHNTTERQGNTTQLAQGSHFSKKKVASGGTGTYDRPLARGRSYQLSYRGSSAGWARITPCVCLLSHISPLERLFVLKILSRTQRATEVS